MLRNLCMTQSFTPFNIRMLLAKTYLIPTLLYGCELFAAMDSVSKNKFKVTYNNIARYIFGRSNCSSISHFFYKIYNMSLENLLKCRMLIFPHKIIHVGEPNYLFTRLQFSRTNIGYRINAMRYRKQMSERHFFINAICSCNLPLEIQLKSILRRQFQCTFLFFKG